MKGCWYAVFDYITRVIIGDAYLFFGGILAGILLILWRLSRVLPKVYIVPDMKHTKANMVLVQDKNGEKHLYVNPRTPIQTFDIFVDFILWRIKGSKSNNITHTITNDKRSKRIIYFVFLSCLIIIVSCVYLIFTIQK